MSERLLGAVFDLDGVITDTARLHAQAWKHLFDDFLARRAKGRTVAPFDLVEDYLAHVDGKPRGAGVHDFLESRGITLPPGGRDDKRDDETEQGLGQRKDGYFLAALRREPVTVFPGSLRLLQQLRSAGIALAIASSSRNCREVLASAGIEDLFDVRVDGLTLARRQIAGKPDPAMFLKAARGLQVAPAHCAVFEDAQSGVAAGRAGGFGLVVGVARQQNAGELLSQGADLVVADLGELSVAAINEWFDDHRPALSA